MAPERIYLRSERDQIIRDIQETMRRVPTAELADCLESLKANALPAGAFLPALLSPALAAQGSASVDAGV